MRPTGSWGGRWGAGEGRTKARKRSRSWKIRGEGSVFALLFQGSDTYEEGIEVGWGLCDHGEREVFGLLFQGRDSGMKGSVRVHEPVAKGGDHFQSFFKNGNVGGEALGVM